MNEPTPSQPIDDPDEFVPGGPIRVRVFGRTDVGQVREHNEDNFIVADLTRKSRGLMEGDRMQLVGPRGTLMGVCDGMGGAAAGEVASQLAVDIIFERMADQDEPKDRDDVARRIVRAIEEAGSKIYQDAKADRTRRGMGTTSTVASLIDDYLFFGQVGDSRAYVLRGGRFVQVTRDQSLVNQLIEAGQLTEEEAETFEHNNIILQALGTSDTVQVDLTYVELRRGDVLMLCSDGLSGMVRADEMREILSSVPEPLEACKLLTEKANQAGGHDNITCIVARFEGQGLKPPVADDPELKYRKYALPEEGGQPVEQTQPTHRGAMDSLRAGAADRLSDHGPSQSKMGNTVVGMNLSDIADRLPPGTLDKRPSSRPPQGNDDPVDLPMPATPPWMVGLWLIIAIAVVGAAGFWLLRPLGLEVRWPLARRLLALPLTVLVVTVLAFAALSASGSEDPALAHLPRFLNTRLLDVRARAEVAMAALAEREDPEAAHTLSRLGGAALPVVLPRLDGLAPGPRTRVALSLAPLAIRMELPDAHQDPALAAAAWQRWWEDHAPDWKPVAIRRVVHRYATHPSRARQEDVRRLDTAALADIVRELSSSPSAEVREGLLSSAEHALGLVGEGDLDARTAELEVSWRARGLDFVALDGAARPVAAVLETRYGKWATRALVGDLGRARDGRAVLLVIIAAARTTLSVVGVGAPVGALVAVLVAVPLAVASATRARWMLVAPVLAVGAVPSVVALMALGPALVRGALAVAAVVLAGSLPVVLARLTLTLSRPDVVTARAFGASELGIVLRAVRSGALPCALACLGTSLPASFTASFVVEKLLALPGLGRVAAEAVAARDVTVLMAIAVLASLCGVVALAIADLAQLAGDRRIAEAP